jgi:uncharacterized membrane protein YjjB (DUF3815 family)
MLYLFSQLSLDMVVNIFPASKLYYSCLLICDHLHLPNYHNVVSEAILSQIITYISDHLSYLYSSNTTLQMIAGIEEQYPSYLKTMLTAAQTIIDKTRDDLDVTSLTLVIDTMILLLNDQTQSSELTSLSISLMNSAIRAISCCEENAPACSSSHHQLQKIRSTSADMDVNAIFLRVFSLLIDRLRILMSNVRVSLQLSSAKIPDETTQGEMMMLIGCMSTLSSLYELSHHRVTSISAATSHQLIVKAVSLQAQRVSMSLIQLIQSFVDRGLPPINKLIEQYHHQLAAVAVPAARTSRSLRPSSDLNAKMKNKATSEDNVWQRGQQPPSPMNALLELDGMLRSFVFRLLAEVVNTCSSNAFSSAWLLMMTESIAIDTYFAKSLGAWIRSGNFEPSNLPDLSSEHLQKLQSPILCALQSRRPYLAIVQREVLRCLRFMLQQSQASLCKWLALLPSFLSSSSTNSSNSAKRSSSVVNESKRMSSSPTIASAKDDSTRKGTRNATRHHAMDKVSSPIPSPIMIML